MIAPIDDRDLFVIQAAVSLIPISYRYHSIPGPRHLRSAIVAAAAEQRRNTR